MASFALAMLRKRRIVSLFSVNLHLGAMKLKLGESKYGMEISTVLPIINTPKRHVNKTNISP